MSAVADRPPATRFSPGRFLSFNLAEELYAINVNQVLEIIRLQPVTPVPNKPDYVKGIMNLRGKVIPVVDMRLKFRLGKDTVTERPQIVIVVEVTHPEQGPASAGLIVDAVDEVTFISDAEVESHPGLGSTDTTDHVTALAKVKERLISILDIDRVIIEETFAALETL